MAGFMCIQPFMTKTVVSLAGQGEVPPRTVGAMAGAAILMYLGIAVTTAIGEYFMSRQMVKVRAALLPAIYLKHFRLGGQRLRKTTAVTLASADADSIMNAVFYFHRILQNGVIVISGIVVLGFLVGLAAVCVLVPTLLAIVVSIRIALSIRPAQKFWNAALDRRITTTSDTLGAIISVKMAGLTNVAKQALHDLMVDEANASKKTRTLNTWTYAVGDVTATWSAAAVIAGALFWTRAASGLSISDIYAILSVCALIGEPLFLVMLAFSQFNGGLASFDRVQAFLLLEETDDVRETFSERQSEEKMSQDDSDVAVRLSNVSVKPLPTGAQPIRNVSLSIPARKTTMVIGPVGSGKTVLLKTIIGEVEISDGQILLDDSIAYCGQTPWLCNTTIKSNIVGDYPFSSIRYEAVLDACMLMPDIRSMADGDDTLVGNDGCNLSGGQRQRVALARAIYCAKSILILDNAFSGLDQLTATSIFNNLFAFDGHLKKSQATVILATTLAGHMQFADQVVTMNEQGGVQISIPSQGGFTLPGYLHRQTSVGMSDSESELLRRHNDVPKSKPVQQAVEKEAKVIGEEDLARQRGDLSIYWLYIRAVGWKSFLGMLFVFVLAVFTHRFPIIFVRIWYSMDPSNKVYFAGFAGVCFFSLFTWLAAFWFWYNYLVANTMISLHETLLGSVMTATISFITRTEKASLVNRFSDDMAIFSHRLPAAMSTSCLSIIYITIEFALVCSSSTIGVILIPICGVPFYFLQKFYLRTSRQLRQLQLENQVPIVKQITEVATGMEHIRPMRMQKAFIDGGFYNIDQSSKAVYYMRCIQQWLALVVNMLVMVIAVVMIVIALTSRRFASENSIGVGMVTLIPLGENMGIAVKVWTELETALGAMARLKWFTKTTPSEPNAEATPEQASQFASWPKTGKVEFRDTCASYRPGARLVVDHVSFIAQHGENFGITGRTGSGKSSLLLTTLGFLQYEGSVLLDGVELRTIPLDILRSRITTITQNTLEFPGTLRYNLYPYPQDSNGLVPEELYKQTLVDLRLWDDLSTRGGLDADIASLHLSQGQRQLINIGRAIIHHIHTKSKIAIMDEATSGLDHNAALNVLELIDDMFEDCTILMVEHRDTARGYMDNELVIKNGSQVMTCSRAQDHAAVRLARLEKLRDLEKRAEMRSQAARLARDQEGQTRNGSATSSEIADAQHVETVHTSSRQSLESRRSSTYGRNSAHVSDSGESDSRRSVQERRRQRRPRDRDEDSDYD